MLKGTKVIIKYGYKRLNEDCKQLDDIYNFVKCKFDFNLKLCRPKVSVPVSVSYNWTCIENVFVISKQEA